MKSPKYLLHAQLSEPETDLYLALLQLGKTRVSKLAKQVGMDRSLAYFHLKHLQEKGYVRESRAGSVKQFVATPPNEVAKRLQDWSASFAAVVPALERLGFPDPQSPTIEVFESREGYKRLYDEIASLEPGSMFRVLEGKHALRSELDLLTQAEWQRFFTRIVERKIETKGLFTDATRALPQTKLSKQNHALLTKRVWHLRLIEEARLPFDDLLMIYGHKIAFLFPEDSLVVTLEHAGIARVLTIMFETLFLLGSPVKEGWR